MSPLSEISARYCDVRAMCEPTATLRHPAGGGRHLERVLGLRVGSSVRKGIVMDSWEKPSGPPWGPGRPGDAVGDPQAFNKNIPERLARC